MEILYYLIIFILGTIIGSFLNVVINRYNTGLSLNGRSTCFSCGHKLSWYELIPIISFLVQKGRCGMCKSSISLQYPAVEFLTGILFVSVIYHKPIIGYYGALNIFYIWVIFSLLVVITVYDIKHKIIPNGFVYVFILLSFLGLFTTFVPFNMQLQAGVPTIWNLLAGPILAAPFAFLWLVSRGTWMGLGDVKLILGMGWFFGLYYGVSAVIISFWIGAIFGIILLTGIFNNLFLGSKKLTMKSEIPFGPFLTIGILIVFLFNIDVFNLLI
jgi:prepilin signal peptidase PulO-like enzyme (type II secretory pathway)